jgi:hypothetical protein
VLVQVIDVLDHSAVGTAADGDEVGHREVLHELAQPDAPGVRTHGNAELGGQQQDRQVLVHSADTAGIELQHRDRTCLEQLLEHDPVRDVLAGGDSDRRHRAGDGRHPEHVVR